MNICYVISTVNLAGGANRSLLEFLPYIIEAGHNCTVLACAHGTMEEAVLDLGAEYKVLPFSTYVRASTAAKRIKRRSANSIGRIAISSFIKSQGFDLVHNNSLPTAIGMDAAFHLGIPYVCHIRENVWDGLGMEFYCPARVKRIVQNANCVITISNYIMEEYYNTFPNNNYLVINDGIKTDDYYDRREIFQNNIVRIGIIGVINPQKGQTEAVRAVELLHEKGYSNIELDIVGDAGLWNGSRDYARNLKKDIEDKGMDYVHFIPAIEQLDHLKKQREKYDINVICSNAEGLGRTTIESMLSGALTIAAKAGATPEVIEDNKDGLLYKSGNVEDLAQKIVYAMEHTDLARSIARDARERAKMRFSVEDYAQKLLNAYSSISSDIR